MFTKHPSKRGARITNVQNVAQRQCILEEKESLLGKTCHRDFQDTGWLPSNYQYLFETVQYISPKSTS